MKHQNGFHYDEASHQWREDARTKEPQQEPQPEPQPAAKEPEKE